ncbi:TPA: hypothetical protein ACGW3F_005283 [Bacillus paranthracis]
MALLSYMDVVARLKRMNACKGITEVEKHKNELRIQWILLVNEK